MRDDDYDAFRMTIRVLGASYEQFMGDEHIGYYWSVLEHEPFEHVDALCNRLTRCEHESGTKMPSAHQLRRELESRQRGAAHELPCQQPGCRALMPGPPHGDGEGRYFCPRHQPEHGRPASVGERQAILAQLTAEGRAFLRSAVASLMTDIPITDAEREAAERLDAPRRALAFVGTADGPGVNPGVFLTTRNLAGDLHPEYAERRQMVAAAGWTYKPGQGVWAKGKRRLSDEDIDRVSDRDVLATLLGHR